MGDQDQPDAAPDAAEPKPTPKPARAALPKRDLAETTGHVAGRTALGLTRLLLRNKTVRQTLRSARDANRDSD